MYKVKFGGKKGKTIDLVESPDMVAIRTKGNKNLEDLKVSRESKEILSDSTTVVAFPEAGVTVKRINKAAELESTGIRDQARNTLKQEEGIRFAGRVLTDSKSGQVMLYTENFFVKFKDDVAEADCLEILKKYKLTIKDKLVFAKNSYFVEAEEGTGLEVFNIAEQVLAEKPVEFCHPELVQERRFKAIHQLQWHLAKTTIEGKNVDAGINVEAAWKVTRGKGITVAIVDDGVDVDHPEFAGRIVHPRDVTIGSDDPRPKEEDDNHGTACAGVACAAGLEGGASGTAPEANLMPIRLRSGLGSMAEANAFVWAADHGADVISCSWGPTDGDWWDLNHALHRKATPLPDSTRLAMEYALTKGRNGRGCVILFAAGNGNEDTKFDGYASFPGVIAVAASNDTSRRSVYSDFGKSVWVAFPSGDFAYKPFKHPKPISDGIRTVDRAKTMGYSPDNYTDSFGGTSSACPGMAGVVALMLAANPNLEPAEVKEIIKNSTHKIDAEEGEYDETGHSIYYGYGRIDAGKAVENAQKAAQNQPGPSIEGTVSFVTVGEVRLRQGEFVGNFNQPKKALGFAFNLRRAEAGLKLRCKANVSGVGILENDGAGSYVGADSGRRNLLGFALSLEGDGAANYDVEYSAKLKDSDEIFTAKNGKFCGTDKKTGKPLMALSVAVKKR